CLPQPQHFLSGWPGSASVAEMRVIWHLRILRLTCHRCHSRGPKPTGPRLQVSPPLLGRTCSSRTPSAQSIWPSFAPPPFQPLSLLQRTSNGGETERLCLGT